MLLFDTKATHSTTMLCNVNEVFWMTEGATKLMQGQPISPQKNLNHLDLQCSVLVSPFK